MSPPPGQPRGPRSAPRDALARRRPDPGDLDVPGDALEVGDEPFEAPDGHRLPLLPEDARHFALFLLGADAAAHRRERIGLLDFPRRLDELPLGHKVDELGDLDADGAPLHALRVLALDAAGRLKDGEVRGQPERDFPEVPDPHLRRPLRHRPAGNAERFRAWLGGDDVGHQFPPPAGTAAPPMHLPSLCSIRSIASFSSLRYARLRITNSLKSTWWPSNSGPSTQTNFVVPPTVTRHAPHIPVASTMIGLRLTTVLIPWGRVTSAPARWRSPGRSSRPGRSIPAGRSSRTPSSRTTRRRWSPRSRRRSPASRPRGSGGPSSARRRSRAAGSPPAWSRPRGGEREPSH